MGSVSVVVSSLVFCGVGPPAGLCIVFGSHCWHDSHLSKTLPESFVGLWVFASSVSSGILVPGELVDDSRD